MADERGHNGRDAAILQTWLRLAEHEAAHPGQPYATVLHLRQSRPETSIAELARELRDMVGSPVSPDLFREVLYQARRKFMEWYIERGQGQP